MSNENAVQLAVGDRVGSYRIVNYLDGNTYRAVHIGSARRALIEIAPGTSWRETTVQMLRAQRLVDMLQHPGIARIVERGMLADRTPWMATEVPSGIGLGDLIERRVMPAHETASLIRDVSAVLAYAHDLDVMHGALTVRSIVIATGAHKFPISVADWGIRVEELGVYGAPELSKGVPIDGRADVYALGVIAFRSATCTFPGERGVFDVPGVPTALATLIARMLAIDPSERPTAVEVHGSVCELLSDDALDTAPMLRLEPDDLVEEDDGDDFVHAGAPRFSRPRWTPSPDVRITSERAPTASGEIRKKT
jgi:serine/threonine-protein kinase